MSRTLAALLALAMASGLHAATAAGASVIGRQDGVHIVDLMPEFWAFEALARGRPAAEQARLFTEQVAARHPEAYAAEVIGLDPQQPHREQLERRYQRVQALVADRMPLMRRLSASIASDLPRHEARFREVFPDLAYRGDIYVMHSLGGFDGAVRTVGGHEALLFGVDMMAYVYGSDVDPAPFFHHELFHAYQARFASPDEPRRLIAALWREGLATYVAHALNPQAAGIAVFGLPRSTPQRVAARLPELARRIRTLLDSTSADDYAQWFLGARDDAAIPARSGYFLGYLVAERLARQHTLFELAHLPLARLRPEIEATLASFEALR